MSSLLLQLLNIRFFFSGIKWNKLSFGNDILLKTWIALFNNDCWHSILGLCFLPQAAQIPRFPSQHRMEPTSYDAALTRPTTLPVLRHKQKTAPLHQIQTPKVRAGDPNGPHMDKEEVCRENIGRPGMANMLPVPVRIMVDLLGKQRAPAEDENICSVPIRGLVIISINVMLDWCFLWLIWRIEWLYHVPLCIF